MTNQSVDRYDILMVGAGIFGLTAAIEMAKRNYKVGLINPNSIPHHLAASTDISKAVRMEYGSDQLYFRMAEKSIKRWLEWNDLLGTRLYHQVGFLMLAKDRITSGSQAFEKSSYDKLKESGYEPQLLEGEDLKNKIPSINPTTYAQGSYNPIGGYVESSKAIEHLAKYAISLGVDIHQNQTADQLVIQNHMLTGVKTKEGRFFRCGHAHIAAGAQTPLLVPDLAPYIKATGHPVFWVRPKDPELFRPKNFMVFTADISNSGWYGFPYNEAYGVVKVAKHSNGQELDPLLDDRRVTDEETSELRTFLEQGFFGLSDAPLVFTRKCLYTDTLDGHYWIDNHPEIKALSVGTGGCGHGLKMAPVLGEIQADMIEGKPNVFASRFRWRHLSKTSAKKEQARYIKP